MCRFWLNSLKKRTESCLETKILSLLTLGCKLEQCILNKSFFYRLKFQVRKCHLHTSHISGYCISHNNNTWRLTVCFTREVSLHRSVHTFTWRIIPRRTGRSCCSLYHIFVWLHVCGLGRANLIQSYWLAEKPGDSGDF